MTDIDTQSKKEQKQFDVKGIRDWGLGTIILLPSGHWNEVLIWGRFSTQKYLKSVDLKLTTCCSKIYPVVLSFNTHYRILSTTVNPNPRKFWVKVYPNHRTFPVKGYPNPRIFRPKTTQNWRTSPSYPKWGTPPGGDLINPKVRPKTM